MTRGGCNSPVYRTFKTAFRGPQAACDATGMLPIPFQNKCSNFVSQLSHVYLSVLFQYSDLQNRLWDLHAAFNLLFTNQEIKSATGN